MSLSTTMEPAQKAKHRASTAALKVLIEGPVEPSTVSRMTETATVWLLPAELGHGDGFSLTMTPDVLHQRA